LGHDDIAVGLSSRAATTERFDDWYLEFPWISKIGYLDFPLRVLDFVISVSGGGTSAD
jgi:hypothetical protein